MNDLFTMEFTMEFVVDFPLVATSSDYSYLWIQHSSIACITASVFHIALPNYWVM